MDKLPPEQTAAMKRMGSEILKAEFDERWEHTKIIAKASGMKL